MCNVYARATWDMVFFRERGYGLPVVQVTRFTVVSLT